LTGKAPAETTGVDNFETVRLVHASYAAAKSRQIVDMIRF
jgi:hypothetical protein